MGVNDMELNRFVNALGEGLGRDSVVSISRTKILCLRTPFKPLIYWGAKKRLSARFLMIKEFGRWFVFKSDR